MAEDRDSGKRSIKSDSEVMLKWWHVISVALFLAVGLGEARVSLANLGKDVESLSEAVRGHSELAGHPLEVERANRLRMDLDASTEAYRQILTELSKIQANQIRLCQKQGVTCRE